MAFNSFHLIPAAVGLILTVLSTSAFGQNLQWAKQIGDSASIDEKSSLEIDAFGNLYITNSFVGTVDFDPGPGSFNLTSQGMDRAVFIQKLDANGNFIWAKQIGGPFVPGFPNPTHSNAIAVDAG